MTNEKPVERDVAADLLNALPAKSKAKLGKILNGAPTPAAKPMSKPNPPTAAERKAIAVTSVVVKPGKSTAPSKPVSNKRKAQALPVLAHGSKVKAVEIEKNRKAALKKLAAQTGSDKPKGKAGRKSKFAPTMKIRVLDTDRTVRKESVDGRIWNAIKSGMTVAQYMAAAAKVKGGKSRNLSGMLSHFVRQQFVSVR